MRHSITFRRRGLFRVLALGFAVAAVAAPAGLADAGYNFDNSPTVIPYLSHGVGVDESAELVYGTPKEYIRNPVTTSTTDDALARMIANDAIHSDPVDAPAPVIVRVDAPASAFDWGDMAIGLAIGLGGAFLLGAAAGAAYKLRPVH